MVRKWDCLKTKNKFSLILDTQSNQRFKIENQLFKNNLARDSASTDSYFSKLGKRFKSCCRCLSNLFIHCDDQLAKIRINDLNEFLKKIFHFDYKSMVLDLNVNYFMIF